MNKKEYELVGDLLREKRENDKAIRLLNGKAPRNDRTVGNMYVRFYYSEGIYDFESFELNKSIQKLVKEAYISRQKEIEATLKKLGYED